MLSNHLLTAWRNFKKRPLFSLINVTGLSLGIGLFLLILLYVQFEHSYDTFQAQFDHTYRVEINLDGKGRCIGFSQPAMGPHLQSHFPEVEKTVSFYNTGDQAISTGSALPVTESQGWWADDAFLEFFSFNLIKGDAATALEAPFTMVITQDLAEKHFPNSDPMGATLRVNDEHDFKVTGIIENCPANSSLQYRYLLSFASYKTIQSPDYFESWHGWQYTYIQLHPQTDVVAFNSKIENLLQTTIDGNYPCKVYLKAMKDFHFHSQVIGGIGITGDLNRIRLYTAIGLFVLLIACINFMNLSTAQATKRMKEVGLRKTLGADRKELMGQFLGESIFLAMLAMILGVLWATLGLPAMNQIMGRHIPLAWLFSLPFILQVLGIGLITGIMAGSYPAFMLSGFRPAVILRGSSRSQSGSATVRKILVICQFAISIVLIIGTLVIQKQMSYMRHKDLGIDHSAVLISSFHKMDQATQTRYQTLRNQWEALPQVEQVTYSLFTPGFNGASTVITNWEGSTADENIYIYTNQVDTYFLDTYDIALTQGRNFRANNAADATTCIINETAAKTFGWDNPVGKTIAQDIEIIGVMKDFHFASFREAIAPLWIRPLLPTRNGTRGQYCISIKIKGELLEAREAIDQTFVDAFPTEKFEAEFFDEFIEFRYDSEHTTARTMGFFTALAIFIACLGLFGLSIFTAEQRIKEIGIRKILGATVSQLIQLLLQEFGKWIAIASVMAWPAGYWLLNKWLASYHYHTQLDVMLFVTATVSALFVGLFTVSFQAVKAAHSNPVKTLKCE